MLKKRIVLLLFVSLPSYCAMAPAMRQLIISKPFFDNPHNIICAIKKTIDKIERKRLSYPDYAARKGIIWSDFWINTQTPSVIEECKKNIKITLIDNKLQKHNPESIFNYPTLKNILCQDILPKTLTLIKTSGWSRLPEKVFAQFFLQRCETSEPMDWHQDPGEDYDTMADFSLALMLSNQNDPVYGWQGGTFKIRSGLPLDAYSENDVETIIPEYNQALLFNNKIHSHAVTAITSTHGKRDLIVVPLYLGKEPKPIIEFKE